jgi:homoserine acetyltransferase
LSPQDRRPVLRRASLGQFMQIHRTDANPAMVDLSLDPSSRNCGGINTLRPDLSNYSENGFARILSPKAWLSQWSGLSSRSSLLDNLPRVTVPTVVVSFTGDNAIHPHVGEATLRHAQAADKTLHRIDADHFGFPLASKPESGGRAQVSATLVAWLRERFPSA